MEDMHIHLKKGVNDYTIMKNYINKCINENDASKVLTFTCFNNPLFLYNYLYTLILFIV